MPDESFNPVKTGLDSLLAALGRGEDRFGLSDNDKNIGLVTNSRALDSIGRSNLHSFLERGVGISCIFTPEHGYFANVRDGDYIADGSHPELGIPIYSLFTEGHERNAIAAEGAKENIGKLVFDIQDAGVRFYTYIHALGLAIAGAAELGVPLIVLDRPNPAGMEFVEGFLPERAFRSELCPFDIPVRYALTIGELARFIAGRHQPEAKVFVVPLEGYTRKMYYGDTKMKFVPPSPAMVSPETAQFYPGTCFFEGTNLSEGRGTDAPFRKIGAPFCDGEKIAAGMKKYLSLREFDGIGVEPARFTPSQSKFAGVECGGVSLKSGRPGFAAMKFGLILVKTIYDIHKSEFEFVKSQKSGLYFFDRLAGTERIRKTIMEGAPEDVLALEAEWAPDREKFIRTAQKFKLYPETAGGKS